MTAAISFRGVSATNYFNNLSFEIEPGCSALIVTSAKNEGALLLKLITGIAAPAAGSVHLHGRPLSNMSPAQFYEMRQHIGVVQSNGGLISNLKVLENITLPILYNKGLVSKETEEFVINRLRTLGYNESIMAMPALLSIYEKRVAAFLRATLINPNIMLYDHCFEDMSAASQKSFTAAAAEFHSGAPGRTSVYIISSQEMSKDLDVDIVIKIHETLT
jgi:phospholipid/cholesterol/gamma-HCH transport system ATP-binding protein